MIRRELAEVRPEAEQLDGNIYWFSHGWVIEPNECELYEGENAMLPRDENYPSDAPTWLASGDLVPFLGLH